NGVACSPSTAACGDGGAATGAQLTAPLGVAIGRDGSLYIADGVGGRVRRVTPDGIMRTVAGTGTAGFSGDGGLATQATFRSASGVAIGPVDTLYVIDHDNNRVRWLRPDGPIFTLAGTGPAATSGDGGLASRAEIQHLEDGLAVGPDGSVYVS